MLATLALTRADQLAAADSEATESLQSQPHASASGELPEKRATSPSEASVRVADQVPSTPMRGMTEGIPRDAFDKKVMDAFSKTRAKPIMGVY